MDKETRSLCESIVYAYYLSIGMGPSAARGKANNLSDKDFEELHCLSAQGKQK